MANAMWFTILDDASSSSVALVFFHYAGGNSQSFLSLARQIKSPVRILSLNMPGRGSRFVEPLIDDADQAAHEISQAMVRQYSSSATTELIFFGHSMGAKLAFSVAQRLECSGALRVRHLIASGCSAPHIPRTRPMLHNLSDAEFTRELRDYGGTPDEILENQDLLDLLIPMLRSDFKLAETYQVKDETPVACDISVFGGHHDATVEPITLHAWSRYSHGQSDVQMFSGGHFFIREDESRVAKAVDAILALYRPY